MNIPILKTKSIYISYWDCGNPEHSHKRKSYAQTCMDGRVKVKEIPNKKPSQSRAIYITVSALDGCTFSTLSRSLKISPSRVRQIYLATLRKALYVHNLQCEQAARISLLGKDINDCRRDRAIYLNPVNQLAINWGVTSNV